MINTKQKQEIKQHLISKIAAHDKFYEYTDSFESPRYRKGLAEKEEIDKIIRDNPDLVEQEKEIVNYIENEL